MSKVQQALSALPELTDVDTDVEDKGRQVNLIIDRDAATRLGISMSSISTLLNNSYSQRQVRAFESIPCYGGGSAFRRRCRVA